MHVVVSVAMATLNGEAYIIDQLESLARQTLLPAELIITDDGSTDKTLSLIQTYANKLKFPVRTVQNDTRLGYGRNFLKAASLANTEYIAFCDQDDIWHQDKIKMVNEIAAKDEYDLIVHGGKVVDAALMELGELFPEVDDGLIAVDQYSKIFIPGYAMTVKKEFLARIGFESLIQIEGLDFEHDLWICNSILGGGTCYGINKQLVSYRQHDSNVIGFAALMSSERHTTSRKTEAS